MRFFRRIAGILGFLKDEPHEEEDDDSLNHHHHHNNNNNHHHHRDGKEETRRPTKGFSVQVPVAVDKPHIGPVLTPSNLSDGGVQGLRWYARRLRIDEDGDVADEFLDEVWPDAVEMPPNTEDRRPIPKFEVKYRTRPAKVKKQMISPDGKVQQSVEFQGRLQWV